MTPPDWIGLPSGTISAGCSWLRRCPIRGLTVFRGTSFAGEQNPSFVLEVLPVDRRNNADIAGRIPPIASRLIEAGTLMTNA